LIDEGALLVFTSIFICYWVGAGGWKKLAYFLGLKNARWLVAA
jgi:hypothetical protein